MNRWLKTAILSFSMIGMTGTGVLCYAGIEFTAPFKVSLQPEGSIQKGAPFTAKLSYEVTPKYYHLAGDTGSYKIIFLDPRNHDDTLSKQIYPVSYDSTFSYSVAVDIKLPPPDTNCCVVRVACGSLSQRFWYYFISDGDSVKFLTHFSMPMPLRYLQNAIHVDTAHENKDIDRDTLTYQQLQAELDMAVDLRDKAHMKMAREILGDISDTCNIEGMKDQYIIRMTLEQAYKLHDMGIPLEWARGKKKNRP